jgi:hypothetical protein
VEPTAESAMYAALEKGLVVAEDEIGGGSQQVSANRHAFSALPS